MSHVFVRLSGYGLLLLPYWPYRFARDGESVKVACWAAPGVKEVTVDGWSVDGVVDIEDGPGGDWRIETTIFSCAWPEGFTIESPTDPGDATRFYLFGPGNEMIFPRGPTARAPEPAGWAAPGQKVTAVTEVNGIEVVELKYKHDGVPWWQSHWMLPWGTDRKLIFTAQAPAAQKKSAKDALMLVAATVG